MVVMMMKINKYFFLKNICKDHSPSGITNFLKCSDAIRLAAVPNEEQEGSPRIHRDQLLR